MKSAKLSILGMTGLMCTALAAPPMLYAQATAPSHEKAASEEMQASGTAAKGMEPGQTLKHAYRASRDEVTDADLTTEIKAALMRDRETRTTAIHVKSNQGLVTLTGTV